MPLLRPFDLQWVFDHSDLSNLAPDQKLSIAYEAEALVASEMGLGAFADDAASADPEPQGLAERQVSTSFTLERDQKLLISPIGPIRSLDSLAIDGTTVPTASLVVQPWTLRRRDGECFEDQATIAMAAAVGWADAATLPERIRSALQLIVFDLAQIHEPRVTVIDESIGNALSRTYARPRRDRVRELIGPLVSPWSRPAIF